MLSDEGFEKFVSVAYFPISLGRSAQVRVMERPLLTLEAHCSLRHHHHCHLGARFVARGSMHTFSHVLTKADGYYCHHFFGACAYCCYCWKPVYAKFLPFHPVPRLLLLTKPQHWHVAEHQLCVPHVREAHSHSVSQSRLLVCLGIPNAFHLECAASGLC